MNSALPEALRPSIMRARHSDLSSIRWLLYVELLPSADITEEALAVSPHQLLNMPRLPVSDTTPVTIYHNPGCGTSRNTLALIRNAGVEPTIIEYLKTPPDRATLESLISRMGIGPRELLRQKGTPYDELGLGSPHWSDGELIEQMLKHPILINRPIVITPWGAKLCRPSEAVLDILPQKGPF